ncbi:polysaccharide biosynthesis/export family protein [Maridesulfovibrio hydrothermalis]|uniref:Polysaccharide export protein n=1 Tax=Maridesulfovibrio hydrothermalis AM13 = DSM 14728 TaxID=1121451 RepID=L0RF51_9BACT|nr:polysaccharide biosynthesis/export family protein [Maridesulfovibrio hydrothermalis]CCO24830.1 Polysaccharide export protein [Maridesulfovibrio hydrothermalis AM13 = DSM 14728]
MKSFKLLGFIFVVTFIAFLSHDAYAQEAKNSGYKLGPEDIVEISVWGDEELAREVVVRPDGGVSFPLAGDLQAGGLTVDQLREEVRKRIIEYVPDAAVTVILRKVENPKVYVMGKVKNPKMLVMGQEMTVVQALAMSAGLSPFAESGSIIIVRRLPDGTQKVFNFDYDEFTEGENLEQNIVLIPGDTVVVP